MADWPLYSASESRVYRYDASGAVAGSGPVPFHAEQIAVWNGYILGAGFGGVYEAEPIGPTYTSTYTTPYVSRIAALPGQYAVCATSLPPYKLLFLRFGRNLPSTEVTVEGGAVTSLSASSGSHGAIYTAQGNTIVRRNLTSGAVDWVYDCGAAVMAVAAAPFHVAAIVANGSVLVLSWNGFLASAPFTGISSAVGSSPKLVFDGTYYLYASDHTTTYKLRWQPSLELVTTFPGQVQTVDPDGNVYIAQGGEVHKYDWVGGHLLTIPQDFDDPQFRWAASPGTYGIYSSAWSELRPNTATLNEQGVPSLDTISGSVQVSGSIADAPVYSRDWIDAKVAIAGTVAESGVMSSDLLRALHVADIDATLNEAGRLSLDTIVGSAWATAGLAESGGASLEAITAQARITGRLVEAGGISRDQIFASTNFGELFAAMRLNPALQAEVQLL